MPLLTTESHIGETIHYRDFELTPVNQVLKIQLPWYHAGFIWNRPKAVVLREADGLERVLPVVDVTRTVIWAMLAGGLVGTLVMSLVLRRR
jgi:hypothetical protein